MPDKTRPNGAPVTILSYELVEDVFAEAIGRPRLLAQLLGLFAGLALLLAAIGSYGVRRTWSPSGSGRSAFGWRQEPV